MLSSEQRKALLGIARASLEAAAGKQPYTPACDDPILREPGACFVTLKRDGELRGCIGVTEPYDPLYEAVARMARASALEDPRFPPVQPTEVPDLTIEISILSSPERVTDVNEIVIGTHGLVIEQEGRRGLLLPQVPVEWGWDCTQFLEHCCIKAGLPTNAWEQGAEIYSFSAEVFGEENQGS
jgi:AmmeMemoRadiSam system protein A